LGFLPYRTVVSTSVLSPIAQCDTSAIALYQCDSAIALVETKLKLSLTYFIAYIALSCNDLIVVNRKSPIINILEM